MTKEEFLAQASQYNRVPVVREVLADLDTPVGAYLKLADGPYSYLLESVEGGENWGRYSVIGLPCREVITVKAGGVIERHKDGQQISSDTVPDPLAAIDALRHEYRVAPVDGLPPFTGGLVGYFAHETIRYVEPRLAKHSAADEIGTPDILLMVSEELLVFDTFLGRLYLIVHANPATDGAWEQAQTRLDALVSGLRTAVPQPKAHTPKTIGEEDFVSGFGRDKHEQAVDKIKQYVRDGDCMQVVVSQRMSVDYDAGAMNLYRALRTLNPSPYMYLMNLGDHEVVGSSPEILVRAQEGKITLRPIAGTRRRGRTPEEDVAMEQELLSDPKELAEHLMLIDLGRNDVGRVSKNGSVKLTDKMVIERYSHVMHITSNVVGDLNDGMGPIDALRATFPAGTLSGAPKIRAMEIIDELEPVRRGVYGGAVGYISWTGNMDTAIAIRTAVIKNGKLYLQAGGGIVADSKPELEWMETMNKARAMMRAVAMASEGLV